MASIVVTGDTSGAITIAAPAVAGTNTLTLPASTGTLVVTGGAQTIEFADGSAAAPSITNSGDTNTGMFFPAADTIAFTEGGVEAMRLDSSGNVGIGTSSPAQKLDVNGSIVVAASQNLYFNNASGFSPRLTNSGSNDALSIFTNNTERMRIASDGTISTTIGSTLYGAYSARAWVNFNGTGTVAIRQSRNVSSITDNGSGDYTVNLTTAMPDGEYSAVSSGGTGGNNIRMSSCSPVSTTSTSQIRVIGITVGAGSLIDLDVVSVAIFR